MGHWRAPPPDGAPPQGRLRPPLRADCHCSRLPSLLYSNSQPLKEAALLDTEASDRLLDRVHKLLAKAEDESVTPPEAQALTAKAAGLMAKYGIDRGLRAAGGPGQRRTCCAGSPPRCAASASCWPPTARAHESTSSVTPPISSERISSTRRC